MSLARSLMVLLSLVIMLTGCGGGGGSASPPSPSGGGGGATTASIVSGVAATGAPISGTVYLKDSSNPAKELSTAIRTDGSFSFNVTGLTAPFLLKAVGASNGQNYTLYSLAGAPGTANINPLSHLAVVRANGGVDPAALYATPTAAQMQALQAALASSISQIRTLLQQILSQYGVASANFITDAYTANHTGLDLLFDFISIVVNNGVVTVANKNTLAPILSTSLTGSTLSGQIITANIPTMPSIANGSVYIYPSTASVAAGGTIKFYGIVFGTTNQSLTWSVVEPSGGSITSAGVYTAPPTPGTYHVKATSAATTQSSTATVTVTTGSTSNNIGSIWKTNSSVNPAVTVGIGNLIGSTGSYNFYAGSIQCSVLTNGGVSFTTLSEGTGAYSSNGILTGPDINGLIGTIINADDGKYWIYVVIPNNIATTASTTVSAYVSIASYSGSTVYSGNTTFIKQ